MDLVKLGSVRRWRRGGNLVDTRIDDRNVGEGDG